MVKGVVTRRKPLRIKVVGRSIQKFPDSNYKAIFGEEVALLPDIGTGGITVVSLLEAADDQPECSEDVGEEVFRDIE